MVETRFRPAHLPQFQQLDKGVWGLGGTTNIYLTGLSLQQKLIEYPCARPWGHSSELNRCDVCFMSYSLVSCFEGKVKQDIETT